MIGGRSKLKKICESKLMRLRMESSEVTRSNRPTVMPRVACQEVIKQAQGHESESFGEGRVSQTCENGDDRLVNSLDLPFLEEVAGQEGGDEQHNGDEESPGGDQLLLRTIGTYVEVSMGLRASSNHNGMP